MLFSEEFGTGTASGVWSNEVMDTDPTKTEGQLREHISVSRHKEFEA